MKPIQTILIGTSVVAAGVAVWAQVRLNAPPAESLSLRVYGVQLRDAIELRWVPSSGWIPSSGLFVYEVTGGRERAMSRGSLAPRMADDETWRTASLPLSTPRPEEGRSVQSSGTAFEAIRRDIGAKPPPKLGSPEVHLQGAIQSSSAFRAFEGRMNRPSPPPAATRAIPATRPGIGRIDPRVQPSLRLAPDEAINDARDSLRLLALTNDEAASMMGMRLRIPTAPEREQRTFEIRNADRVVGKVTVDPKAREVPKPIIQQPIQLAQHRVGLNFALPPGVDPADFGVIKYWVHRIAGEGRMPVNKDPILLTFSETKDKQLVAELFSAIDENAPQGRVTYQVVAEDTFGLQSPAGEVTIGMEDWAVPLGSPSVVAVGPVDRPKQRGVVVYWTSVRYADDEVDKALQPVNPARRSSFSYQIERVDHDDPKAASKFLQGAPMSFKPVELRSIGVELLAKLRPDLDLSSANKEMTAHEVNQSILASQGRGGPARPSIEVYEFRDEDADDDRYYRYRVLTRLDRSGRFGSPAESSPVGVPALVKPGVAQNVAITDRLAGTRAVDFSGIKGAVTNSIAMQREPGLMGPAGFLDPSKRDSAARGREIRRETSPLARIALGTAPAKVPTNYGRVVSLKWAAPSYRTPLTYRVYRAVGTGYRTPTGLPPAVYIRSAKPTGLGVVRAPTQVQPTLTTPTANVGPAGAVGRRVVRSSTSLKLPTQVGKVPAPTRAGQVPGREFKDEFAPLDTEYVLLGETSPGETTFTDVVPRSQSTAYFYRIEAVNRWGEAGSKTAPAKRRLDPSMPPSVPKLEAAQPTPDEKVRVVIVPNVREEDVVKYEVYRMEGELPIPPTPPSNVGSGPGRIKRAFDRVPGALRGAPPTAISGALQGQVAGSPAASRPLSAASSSAPNSASSALGIPSREQPTVVLGEFQRLGGAASTAVARMLDQRNYQKIHTLTVDPKAAGPLEFIDASAVGGKSYLYRVVAVNTANLSSEPSGTLDAAPFKVSVAAPTLAGSPSATATSLSMQIASNARDGVKAYQIERAIDAGAGSRYRHLGVVQAEADFSTLFEDDMVRPGMTYKYRIRAIDYLGNVSKTALELDVSTPDV